MQNKSIAIIIPSCDKYSDMWEPFFFLFRKFWPECSYKIYLVTNHLKPSFPGVEVLNIGEDVTWSANLKKSLNLIPEDNIFLWIDDLFLMEKVDSGKIKKIFNAAIKENLPYICLNGLPKPNKKINNMYGEILPGSLYRVSTVLSLWRKEILQELLSEKESAWQFEIEGSARSDIISNFMVTNKKEIQIVNGVIKGKWRRSVVRKLINFGIDLNFKKRKIFNPFEEFIFSLKRVRSFLFSLLPFKYRREIRKIFIK